MQYLRPAGHARNDDLGWIQYLESTREPRPRPLARDNNNRFSSPDAMMSYHHADSSCSSFDHLFCGFVRLPPELRIEIYKLAFINPCDRYVKWIGRPLGRMPPKSRLRSGRRIRPFSEDVRENKRALGGTPALAVAFACRQVYLEAAPIYYKGIIWHFRSAQWL